MAEPHLRGRGSARRRTRPPAITPLALVQTIVTLCDSFPDGAPAALLLILACLGHRRCGVAAMTADDVDQAGSSTLACVPRPTVALRPRVTHVRKPRESIPFDGPLAAWVVRRLRGIEAGERLFPKAAFRLAIDAISFEVGAEVGWADLRRSDAISQIAAIRDDTMEVDP